LPTSRKRGFTPEGTLDKSPCYRQHFSKITVDIVGPLSPCTVSGNIFILTVIDFASHAPLAYTIKTDTAAEVVRLSMLVLTTFGFPDQILSDCGSV